MAQLPPITISTLDLARLEALLDKQPDSETVRRLEDELERAQVVTPENMPGNIVTMNSVIRFQHGRRRYLYQNPVLSRDIDGSKDKISVLAPIGSALLGLEAGQSIEWPGPNGKTLTVTIAEVEYQPERAGDFQS
ncbi:nucleoside diphosphate kinase regulator [Oceanimonas sp. NS1]|nr:nucleoside diphosphate kinase regulator [Oceanimonas sp. NS1]